MAASDPLETHDQAGSPAQLARDIAILIREELNLAKTELAEKAKSAGIGAGMLSASAITGLFTIGSLTVLVIAALSLAIPLWAAALIVTLLWGAATAALALLGKRKVEDAVPIVPEQTIEHLKEDVEWARRGAHSSPTRSR